MAAVYKVAKCPTTRMQEIPFVHLRVALHGH